MQLAAPRRDSGFVPAIGASNPNLHPDWAASGHHAWSLDPVKHALLNVATLGEHEHPGSVRAYGHELASSFDPSSPEGLFNTAAMFVPGPGKGGRFTGGLTPSQAIYLEQLRTHVGGERLRPDVGDWLEQAGVGPAAIDRARTPYQPRSGGYMTYFTEAELKANPALKEIVDKLGASYEPPFNTLLNEASPMLASDPQAMRRLGLQGDTTPNRTQSAKAFDSILTRHIYSLPLAERQLFRERLMSGDASVRRAAAQELYDGIVNNTPIPTRVADLNTKRIADLIAKNVIQRRN